jgi:hypothetical protein
MAGVMEPGVCVGCCCIASSIARVFVTDADCVPERPFISHDFNGLHGMSRRVEQWTVIQTLFRMTV